jgi:ribosome-binding protein aMBF1 (putative translation factor)
LYIEVIYSIPRKDQVEVKTLGDLIRKRREDAGLTQNKLAKMLGVDHMSVINWEKHGMIPKQKNIEKIKVLKIESNEITKLL